MLSSFLMITSCGQSDSPIEIESGPIDVNFSISAERLSRAGTDVPDAAPTKAYVYVGDKTNNEVIIPAEELKIENGAFIFTITLEKSHKYCVAFWADTGGYEIDAKDGLASIKCTEATKSAPLIAYTKTLDDFKPSGATADIVLQHAVGKLVVRQESELNIGDNLNISFTRNNYSYSAVTGKCEIDGEAQKVNLNLIVDANTKQGDIITAYMLAPGMSKTMIIKDFRLTYTPAGESESHSIDISNVPFSANYRTLISGDFMGLSKVEQTFRVTVDDTWNDLNGNGDSGDDSKDQNTDDDNNDDPGTTSAAITLTASQHLTEQMLSDAVGSGNALKISGPMEDSDFNVLCSWLSSGAGASKSLALDLSNASFTSMPEYAFSTDGDDAYDNTPVQPTTGLSSIILPEGLTEIPAGAFLDCQNLKSVTIPASVESLGELSFYRSGITKLYAPSVTYVYSDALEECLSLTEVTLGALTTVRNNAFRNSTNIRMMDLTRCTAVPSGNNNPFGSTVPENLTIHVASATLMEAFKANAYWGRSGITWSVGAP